MKKILLAEDEEILRMLIVDTFEEEDYVVDEASDGLEALNLLKTNEYDLLIVDYMMPGATGLEVIEHIRDGSNLINNEITILMLSAKSQSYEQERVLKAGANFFIAKPFSPLQLLEKVEEILNAVK